VRRSWNGGAAESGSGDGAGSRYVSRDMIGARRQARAAIRAWAQKGCQNLAGAGYRLDQGRLALTGKDSAWYQYGGSAGPNGWALVRSPGHAGTGTAGTGAGKEQQGSG
jgi:hypothetical protein